MTGTVGWRRRDFFFILVQILTLWSGFFVHVTSGSASNYVDQYLSSPDICPPVSSFQFSTSLTKEKIRLANYPNNTLILKLTRNQGSSSTLRLLNFRCKFQVTAPKGSAVMVVVRSLNLRANGDNTCLDYLQFKREGTFKTREICGLVTADDKSEKPVALIGPRYFNDYMGAIDVTFSTGGSVADSRSQTPPSLELVFTALSQCPNGRKGDSLATGHCSDTGCIPAFLFCDGVVNCAVDEEYGKDEEGCAEITTPTSKAMSIFIFGLTAVGTLLVVVVCVLVICCCLRRCQKVPRNSASRQNSSRDQDRDQEFSLSRAYSSPPNSPTTPNSHSIDPEWGSTTPNAPKLEDLPPSYRDLFPEQRISAKT